MVFWRRRGFWLAFLGTAVIALAAVTAASYWAARQLLYHRSARPGVTPADSGLVAQVVPIGARDGTTLEGWWIVPRDGERRPDLATVVLAHGTDREEVGFPTGKAGMLRYATWLSRAGFIVLAFDFRSYGGSPGTQSTGGYREEQDLEAALRLAKERAIGAPIFVLGEGMGGGIALSLERSALAGIVAIDPPKTPQEALGRGPSRQVLSRIPGCSAWERRMVSGFEPDLPFPEGSESLEKVLSLDRGPEREIRDRALAFLTGRADSARWR